MHNHWCPECKKEKISKKNSKPQEQYIEELYERNSNIICIGEYINSTTEVLHKCLIDGYEWYAKPSNIISGCGCPKCAGNILKTKKEYIKEVSLINPNIEVLGEYINARTRITHMCKMDGYIWNATPSSILSGSGCPKCNESHGEKQIRNWLDNNNITYKSQKTFKECKDKRTLPFDFYLPDYNLVIEYDGEQHYKPIEYFGGEKSFNNIIKHDKIKDNYCKNNNIKILRIPYFENVKEKLDNYYLFA